MKLRASQGRVILEEIIDKESGGGIILPENRGKEPGVTRKGKLVSVGTRTTSKGVTVESECKVGDTVLFKPYPWEVLKYDDEKYIVIEYDNVLAVIDCE